MGSISTRKPDEARNSNQKTVRKISETAIEMANSVCDELIHKNWQYYTDTSTIPHVAGIYVIGVKRPRTRAITYLYLGQSKDIHERIQEHKYGDQRIDGFIKRNFRRNGGKDLRVKSDEMVSKICERLLEKVWRPYELENVPDIEGIYCIGVLSGVPHNQWQLLGEPTVLYVGRSNDVHRRLGEHKRQHLQIDEFVKEEFEENGGENLRIKWIKEKNEETVEMEYIKCIADKLHHWPKFNIKH
ncbi:hypothetical protein ACROYT_G038272 [Oculina patagonica]